MAYRVHNDHPGLAACWELGPHRLRRVWFELELDPELRILLSSIEPSDWRAVTDVNTQHQRGDAQFASLWISLDPADASRRTRATAVRVAPRSDFQLSLFAPYDGYQYRVLVDRRWAEGKTGEALRVL